MLLAVEHHVLVHLVADQQNVGGRQQVLQLEHVGLAPHLAAGVVRAVDEDGAGARCDGGADAFKVGPEAAGCERHTHHHAAGQLDVGHIAVVARLQHDHLVARVHHRQDGGEDGLGGTCGHGDFRVRVTGQAVKRLHFGGHGLAQGGHAGHGRVLVVAGLHGLRHGIHQRRVAVKVRETLPQIDRTGFGRQRRHDGEDGGAYFGQTRGEGGGVGQWRWHINVRRSR